MDLLLSLFPGIDLLGRAFDLEGACVVRGPDLIFGQDVRAFRAVPDKFVGIIAGSPCQDFSRARRAAPSGEGDVAIEEFTRVVTEARPVWFLLENVPGVPAVHVEGYAVQLVHATAAEFGSTQNRRRVFQFGYRDGLPLVLPRKVTPIEKLARCCMASEGQRRTRRSWSEFVQLQGLPADFDLPGWSLASKYRAVGNGVPIPLGRAFSRAIRVRHLLAGSKICVCGCGRPVGERADHATPTCRKRMQRSRDSAGVTVRGPVTHVESHPKRESA